MLGMWAEGDEVVRLPPPSRTVPPGTGGGRMGIVKGADEGFRIADIGPGFPGVLGGAVTLPAHKVFESIPAFPTIQYGLHFVFLFPLRGDHWGHWVLCPSQDGVGYMQLQEVDMEYRVYSHRGGKG